VSLDIWTVEDQPRIGTLAEKTYLLAAVAKVNVADPTAFGKPVGTIINLVEEAKRTATS
jgi:hypothetical protein